MDQLRIPLRQVIQQAAIAMPPTIKHDIRFAGQPQQIMRGRYRDTALAMMPGKIAMRRAVMGISATVRSLPRSSREAAQGAPLIARM